jgi:hypothetical protein
MNTLKVKSTLYVNALFSISCAAIILIYPTQVAVWLGIENTSYLTLLGSGLLIFAVFVIGVAYYKSTIKAWVYIVSVQDLMWVLASIWVVLSNPFGFSFFGLVLTSVVALFVGVFGSVQIRAIT